MVTVESLSEPDAKSDIAKSQESPKSHKSQCNWQKPTCQVFRCWDWEPWEPLSQRTFPSSGITGMPGAKVNFLHHCQPQAAWIWLRKCGEKTVIFNWFCLLYVMCGQFEGLAVGHPRAVTELSMIEDVFHHSLISIARCLRVLNDRRFPNAKAKMDGWSFFQVNLAIACCLSLAIQAPLEANVEYRIYCTLYNVVQLGAIVMKFWQGVMQIPKKKSFTLR